MAAQVHAAADQLPAGRLVQGGEPADQRQRERIVGGVGEGTPADEVERRGQPVGGRRGGREQRGVHEVGELRAVQFVGGEHQPVRRLGRRRGQQLLGAQDAGPVAALGGVEGAAQFEDALVHVVAVTRGLAR